MKVFNKRLFAILSLSAVLAGCATLDSFLENLGLKNTDKVEQTAITPINESYEFIKTANVRAAPNKDAMVLGTLKAGQRFWALGRTSDNWIAISDGSGQRLGYVYGDLVQKAGKKSTRAPKAVAKEKTPTSSVKNTVNKPTNVESMSESQKANTAQGVNLDDL